MSEFTEFTEFEVAGCFIDTDFDWDDDLEHVERATYRSQADFFGVYGRYLDPEDGFNKASHIRDFSTYDDAMNFVWEIAGTRPIDDTTRHLQ